jgi:hypothetical protein
MGSDTARQDRRAVDQRAGQLACFWAFRVTEVSTAQLRTDQTGTPPAMRDVDRLGEAVRDRLCEIGSTQVSCVATMSSAHGQGRCPKPPLQLPGQSPVWPESEDSEANGEGAITETEEPARTRRKRSAAKK